MSAEHTLGYAEPAAMLSEQLSQPGIVLLPIGGMCNRMAAIISASMLAQEIRVPLTVVWWKTSCVGHSEFLDYFVPPANSIIISPNSDVCNKLIKEKCYRADMINLELCRRQAVGISCDRFIRKSVESSRIPAVERLIDGLNSGVLAFKSIILESIKEYVPLVSNIPGIHIRAYEVDYRGVVENPRSESVVNALINRFDNVARHVGRFYITSDSKRALDHMVNKYDCVWLPRDQSIYNNAFVQRGTVAGFNLGVREWILLYNCARVIGSSQSSYSFLAAARSRQLAVVGVIEPIEPWLNIQVKSAAAPRNDPTKLYIINRSGIRLCGFCSVIVTILSHLCDYEMHYKDGGYLPYILINDGQYAYIDSDNFYTQYFEQLTEATPSRGDVYVDGHNNWLPHNINMVLKCPDKLRAAQTIFTKYINT